MLLRNHDLQVPESDNLERIFKLGYNMLICITGATYPYALLVCIPNEPIGWIVTEIFLQLIPSSCLYMERWILVNGMKIVWGALLAHGAISAAIGGAMFGYFATMFVNSTAIMVNILR